MYLSACGEGQGQAAAERAGAAMTRAAAAHLVEEEDEKQQAQHVELARLLAEHGARDDDATLEGIPRGRGPGRHCQAGPDTTALEVL
jgi:hypothetical protein